MNQFSDEYKKGFLAGIKQQDLNGVSCENCRWFTKGNQYRDDICEMKWECSVFGGKPFMFDSKYVKSDCDFNNE